MKLTRPKYDVAVQAPDGTIAEHTVEITPGDQFRAEFEANAQSLPPIKDAPLNHTSVWLWCALAREGLIDVPYPEFRARLYAWDQVKDDAGQPVAEPVDPTRPDPSGTASSSPTTSPAPSTGSTPTSTPA